MQLGSDIGPSTAEFTGFEFYLKRDSNTPASATLTLKFVNRGPPQTLSNIPTAWTKYTFNHSELVNNAGTVTAISFQSSVAGTYYFDDMSFVLPGGALPKTCASGVDHDTPTPGPTPTPTPTPSNHSESGSGSKTSGVSALTLHISTLLFVLFLFILF